MRKNPHAVSLGRLGGKAGRGAAKARTTEQCRAAALARWQPRELVSFEEAYDLCREMDRPILVRVGAETGTVFPSGHFRPTSADIRPRDSKARMTQFLPNGRRTRP